MRETRAEVLSVDVLSERYRRLFLATGWKSWTPGQFVMVRVPGNAVLLRRPFGIVGVETGVTELCFKIVGQGTKTLAHLKAGDHVDVLGPLGRGFEYVDGATPLLVAGGYGIAPIMGLARQCTAKGCHARIYYGAKEARHILYRDELESLPADVHFFTEDGSLGEKGVVTSAVARALESTSSQAIYACGPKGMLESLAELGQEYDVPTQVSMDEYMACGIGVCLGCMCERADGSQVRACREGPVFNARELKW